MKNLLFIAMIICLTGFVTRAADLIVEEFGSSPTYASITAAINAASDGDRIIIKNRSGNIPWVENITISKTLDFLPYINDSFFIIQGSVTINPASTKTINIIGMYNALGSVTASTVPTGNRAIVRLLGCNLVSGNISFDVNNFDVTVYGNKLNSGYVTLRHGVVLGNDITSASSTALSVNSESTNTTDTLFIIGNRINYTYSNGGYALSWNNNTSNLDIRNNFIQTTQYGIYVAYTLATNTAINKIYNNTISLTSSSYTEYGIYVTSSTNTIVEIMNNLIDKVTGGNTTYGVYASLGSNSQINCYFNYFDNALTYVTNGSFTVNQNNNSGAITVNSTTGVTSQGVDLGNPATLFYDLDLTRNDCGAYGGSFSQNNFFPLFTGSARVFLTSFPFNIRSGNTLSVKATSFDR